MTVRRERGRPLGRRAAAVALLLLVAGLSFLLLRSGDDAVPDAAHGGSGEVTLPSLGGPPTQGAGGAGADGAVSPADLGSVRGRLRRAGSSERTALLRVSEDGSRVVEEPLADGEFVVAYRRGPGRHALTITAPVHQRRHWSLPERTVDVGEVVLVPAVEYGGRVLDARGSPVEGVSVEIVDRTDATIGFSRATGKDGRYRMELDASLPLLPDDEGRLLDHGVYVRVEGDREGPFSAEMAGLQGSHDVVLDPWPTTLRFVREPGGQAIVGARVTLSRAGSMGRPAAERIELRRGETDAEGRFAFRRHRGWTSLTATLAEGSAGTLEIPLWFEPVRSRGEHVVRVSPGAVVELAVAVLTETGAPAAGARVAVAGDWSPGPFRKGDRAREAGLPLDLRGVVSPEGEIRWRLLLEGPGRFRPDRWEVERRPSAPAERGVFPPALLASGDRLPVVQLGERRNRSLPVRVVEGPAMLPVGPVHGVLRLFHTGSAIAGGTVVFSRVPEVLPGGEEVWRCTLPDAVVQALDARLMFDAPVFQLTVEGRAPRQVPIRIPDLTEGLRREEVAVLRVPAVERVESVRVVHGRGAPAADAVVAFVPREAAGNDAFPAIVRGRTDSAGVAVVADLEPGVDYRVVASAPATGHAGQVASWRAERGRALVLAPPQYGTLHVRLPAGARPEDVTVTLDTVPPGLASRIVATADRSGRVELPPAVFSLYEARIEVRAPRTARSPAGPSPVTHVALVPGPELRHHKTVDVKPVP